MTAPVTVTGAGEAIPDGAGRAVARRRHINHAGRHAVGRGSINHGRRDVAYWRRHVDGARCHDDGGGEVYHRRPGHREANSDADADPGV